MGGGAYNRSPGELPTRRGPGRHAPLQLAAHRNCSVQPGKHEEPAAGLPRSEQRYEYVRAHRYVEGSSRNRVFVLAGSTSKTGDAFCE